MPDIEILTAGTYKAAQELIDKHKNDIFLSLLDLNLPDAPDGEIVDFVVEQKIPAVVFSASYTEDIRDRVLSQNVLDYVVKDSPASLDYITNLIRRVHRNRNRNISALVVDDARTARKYVADLLRLYQFNVLEAADGVEALEIIKSNNNIKQLVKVSGKASGSKRQLSRSRVYLGKMREKFLVLKSQIQNMKDQNWRLADNPKAQSKHEKIIIQTKDVSTSLAVFADLVASDYANVKIIID